VKINQRKIDYIIIILITLFATSYIIGTLLINPTGYVTGDSANYLWLSGRILDGHGFFLPTDGREGAVERWFATWPVGYSSLISGVSWTLGVPTLLASKILNIFLLSLAVLALYIVLGQNGLIASLVLLTAGTLRNYTMTWSEAPFLTSIIILCLFLGKILNDDQRVSNKSLIILFFLLILPFLFRYVGLFVLMPTFLIAAYLLFLKRKRESYLIMTVIFFAFIFCLIYLINNLQLTGHFTGIERVQATEGNYKLFLSLISATFQEFILILPHWEPSNLTQTVIVLIWAIFVLFCGILIIKNIRQNIVGKFVSYAYIFMVFGLFYLSSIIFLRWTTSFEIFGSRLLSPGFALFFIGLIVWVLGKSKENKMTTIIMLIVTVIIIAGGNIYSLASKNSLNKFSNYNEHINKVEKKYAQLPDNAIVIFGSRELKYIRPNIRIAYSRNIHGLPIKENWNEFLFSLDKSSPIFIEIKPESDRNELISDFEGPIFDSSSNTLSSVDNIIITLEEYNKK
jgi:hypothetical protein